MTDRPPEKYVVIKRYFASLTRIFGPFDSEAAACEWVARQKPDATLKEAYEVRTVELPDDGLGPTDYGCHVDLEPGMKPDGCVFDSGLISHCVQAELLERQGKGKKDCEYWQPIGFSGRHE